MGEPVEPVVEAAEVAELGGIILRICSRMQLLLHNWPRSYSSLVPSFNITFAFLSSKSYSFNIVRQFFFAGKVSATITALPRLLNPYLSCGDNWFPERNKDNRHHRQYKQEFYQMHFGVLSLFIMAIRFFSEEKLNWLAILN